MTLRELKPSSYSAFDSEKEAWEHVESVKEKLA